MRFIPICAVLSLVATAAQADEEMARKFLQANPGVLKDFDPVRDALKAEGLKGKELKQQAARIKAGMGQQGKPAVAKRTSVKKNARHQNQPNAFVQQPNALAGCANGRCAVPNQVNAFVNGPGITTGNSLTPEQQKRYVRAMRARIRNAQMLAYYASWDAAQWAAFNASEAWFWRNAVPHY